VAAEIAGAGGTVEGAEALATELLAAFSAVRRIVRRAARMAGLDEPLPAAQSELLRLAAGRPGISVADAAHELRLAPNTVSTLVGRLTAAGLLDRARGVADGRSVRLSATDKAARRIAGRRDLRAEVASRALDELADGDRQALADAMPALLRFVAKLDEQNALTGRGPKQLSPKQLSREQPPRERRSRKLFPREQGNAKSTAAAPQLSRTRTGAPRA
jgi:DNA-binding MarR family transcriptional regulator